MREISVLILFRIALKRIWALILALVLASGSAYIYCSFVAKPVYGATASIIVNNGAVISTTDGDTSQKLLGSDIQASLSLVDTVVDMLKTPDIYMYLASKLGNGYDYRNLMRCMSVARRGEETLFVDVTFSDVDPQKAIKIANLFVSAACDYVAEFISKSDPKIVASADRAVLLAPRTFRTTVLAGFIAVLLVYVVFVAFEIFNNTLKGETDFTSRYSIPLLGSVPDFEEARRSAAYTKGRY